MDHRALGSPATIAAASRGRPYISQLISSGCRHLRSRGIANEDLASLYQGTAVVTTGDSPTVDRIVILNDAINNCGADLVDKEFRRAAKHQSEPLNNGITGFSTDTSDALSVHHCHLWRCQMQMSVIEG